MISIEICTIFELVRSLVITCSQIFRMRQRFTQKVKVSNWIFQSMDFTYFEKPQIFRENEITSCKKISQLDTTQELNSIEWGFSLHEITIYFSHLQDSEKMKLGVYRFRYSKKRVVWI